MDKSVFYDSIIEIENFLPIEECCEIIELYNQHSEIVFDWLGTKNIDTQKIKNCLLEELKTKIEAIANQYFNFVKLDVCNIVEWPIDSFMGSHTDDGDAVAFLLYLNENFIGGQTVVENYKTITPCTGKLILFNSSLLSHNVTPVKLNPRYTLAGWYI